MAKLSLVKGTTSYRAYVFISDSSVSTGAGLTGLAFNTASLVASYVRPGAARTAITLATQTTTGAYSSGGFVEIDSTNMPGIYRLDVPDAALATGVNAVVVMLKGATNMAPCVFEVELTAIDQQDAVRYGLTALPNAAAEAAGGLYTRGSGAGQITQPSNGLISVNATQLAAQTITAAAGVTFPTSVASPTNITAGTITTVTNLTNAPTAGDLTATMKTSVTTAATAATPIAASVSGAVGSIATGGIAAASFAAGAIDASAIATDAIGSAEISAAAVTKIQSGLSTYAGGDTSGTTTLLSRLSAARAGYLDNLSAGAVALASSILDAAGIRSAVGLASANLDTQLDTLPTANENADALLDRTAGVETSRTVRQALRLMLAALGGKLSGAATTTVTIRDTNDSKNRIVATVDSDGNRSAVTLDAT